jgi:hypothetical protein
MGFPAEIEAWHPARAYPYHEFKGTKDDAIEKFADGRCEPGTVR